jgi:hypothetical protein
MHYRQWAVTAAVAAAILIAIGAPLWLRHQTRRPDAAGRTVALQFDAFLQQFARDPSSAQNVLLASFNGREVDLQEVERTLGYTPVAGDAVPAGYVVNGVYLLEMPQCSCAKVDCGKAGKCHCGGTCACSQVVYRSAAGRTVSVFEHNEPNSAWFGERPAIRCQCNGVPTELVQIDSQQLAATWKRGNRYVTLVGAQNLEEVKNVMEQLQATSAPGLETPLDTKAS